MPQMEEENHMSTEDHAETAASGKVAHHFIETNGIRMRRDLTPSYMF
jgi:hypothetical protein